MWILPKQLHTSAFVPDMAALISDLDEQSQICAQSLFLRSKPSLPRTWSQKWKRDSWTQHLSGRILKPSLGQTFVTAWTSSLEVIPVSHLVQPGSDLEKTTQDTSGLGSQMELFPCDPESSSSRTSKDTSASDSEMSSKIWRDLVMTRRGEYSLRVKSAHLTNASGSSSWPTCAARDYKGESGSGRQERKGNPADTLPNAVAQHGQADRDSRNTSGNHQESWATPNTMDCLPSRSYEAMKKQATNGQRKNRSKPGNLREQIDPLMCQAYKEAQAEANHWPTPMGQAQGSTGSIAGSSDFSRKVEQIEGMRETPNGPKTGSGKLNPRWVETLMGLPIGWTMPSCITPLTIEPTNCDYLEMESCQPPQPELF